MKHVDGRVTILPSQVRRLADFANEHPGAIEIVQKGSTLRFYNGSSRLSVNANGASIQNTDEE